jgi:hypothetical protein
LNTSDFRARLLGVIIAIVAASAGSAAAQDRAFDTSNMPYKAFDALPATNINIDGATIVLAYAPGGELALSKAEVAAWAERCARIVAGYYGRFPVQKYRLLIMPTPGRGVRGGTTYGYRGAATKLRLGMSAQLPELNNDWVLVHEMIHTAFPSMEDNHHWIEEGLATYVESIARVQAGNLDAATAWAGIVQGMPKGQPQSGDEGLDNTHTWGRTYWGGALFCMVADVRIRERTGNKKGLRDALRGIVKASGSIEEEDWSLAKTLQIGDNATGTRVLQELYAQTGGNPVEEDLAAIWQKLGIRLQNDRAVFDDQAQEADIRRAITAPH